MNNSHELISREKQWAKNIKSGHIDSFEKLYKSYYPRLSQFAYRYVKSSASAEDLVHDVFHNVWKNRENIKVNENIASYLYTATRNRCITFLNRKKNREDLYAGDLNLIKCDEEESDKFFNNEKEIEKAFQLAVQELPSRRRHVFLLSREDNLTYKEIAQVLKISVKTVETQMNRSLKFLQKELYRFIKKDNIFS